MSRDVPSSRRRRRPLFTIAGHPVTRRTLLVSIAVVAALGGLGALWGRIDLETWHARAESLPALGVLGPLCLLPLVGFPVSWLHLIAGARFGIVGGLAAVAVTTCIHHALAWLLVKILPRRFFRRMRPWREKVRHLGYRDAVTLTCLLPGMPYTGQLYLLPLIGAPIPLLLGLTTVLHTARAAVTVLLGEFSDELTPTRIALLVTYYVLLLTVSWWLIRRARRSATDWSETTAPAVARSS